MLLGSGISFVVEAVSAHYTYSQIFPNIPAFVFSYSKYYTGFSAGIICLVITSTGILLYKKQPENRIMLLIVLMFCFFPLIAYIIQRMVVPQLLDKA